MGCQSVSDFVEDYVLQHMSVAAAVDSVWQEVETNTQKEHDPSSDSAWMTPVPCKFVAMFWDHTRSNTLAVLQGSMQLLR